MDHPVTLEEERKVWTIHQSVNGLTYYYNRATKKSQYEMPECFKTTEEVLEHPEWKEYRTAEGKKFYYNATTRKSCWQLPNEVKQYRLKLEERRRKQREENGGRELVVQQLSKQQEIKRKFMALLKSKSVNLQTKWESCVKLCEDDERWGLLKVSDKNKFFKEYQAELKKNHDTEKRAKVEVNKIEFIKMLKENKNLTSDSKMHKVAYDFMIDPRWRILEEHDRESAFQQYIDELWNREKKEQNELRTRCSEMFRSSLQEGKVSHRMHWDEMKSICQKDDYAKHLHPYDRISVFTEYILQAEKKAEEQKIKDKKLKQRTNRKNFRNLLITSLLDGKLHHKMGWKKFVAVMRDHEDLLNMMDPQQVGTTAHQIFQHFMFSVREEHRLYKSEIKTYFKKVSFKMTHRTERSEFKSRLTEMGVFEGPREYLKDYFFIYFREKIESKNNDKHSSRKSSKKERKIIFKIFKGLQQNDVLKTKYSIENQMDHIERQMKNLGYLVSHENIFKYYLAFLQRSEQQEGKNGNERSHSNSSESVKKKGEQQQECLRKFTIPELTELRKQQNELQEEGEIKQEGKD